MRAHILMKVGTMFREFMAVPSKLWMDMLAALRIVPYPMAAAINHGVTVMDNRIANIADSFLRLGYLLTFLTAIFVASQVAIQIWAIRRRA